MAGNPFHRILLVEDQPLEADFIRQELSDQGYAVLWEQDGRAALEVIREKIRIWFYWISGFRNWTASRCSNK